MKRLGCLVVMICLFAASCGGSGDSDQPPNNTPIQTGEILKRISARELPDQRFEYTLAVDMAAVQDDKSKPFYRYKRVQQNWWSDVFYGTVADGWQTFKLTSYDGKLLLLYGGNLSSDSYAAIENSGYFVASQDALGFGLENGRLLKWDEYAQGQFGDTANDPAGVVSFTLVGDRLTIWQNLGFVPETASCAHPYWYSDKTGWLKSPTERPDSRGWASVITTMLDGEIILFTFGGDLTNDTSWATVEGSSYYSAAARAMAIKRQGNAIVTVQ